MRPWQRACTIATASCDSMRTPDAARSASDTPAESKALLRSETNATGLRGRSRRSGSETAGVEDDPSASSDRKFSSELFQSSKEIVRSACGIGGDTAEPGQSPRVCKGA